MILSISCLSLYHLSCLTAKASANFFIFYFNFLTIFFFKFKIFNLENHLRERKIKKHSIDAASTTFENNLIYHSIMPQTFIIIIIINYQQVSELRGNFWVTIRARCTLSESEKRANDKLSCDFFSTLSSLTKQLLEYFFLFFPLPTQQ